MESKTYRKITTDFIKFSDDDESTYPIELKYPIKDMGFRCGTFLLKLAEARQLHAELGEVLKAIEEK